MLRPVTIKDAGFLYSLLEEREHPISHEGMPHYDDHYDFVLNHPYRYWYIVEDDGIRVGAIYLGHDNSIGVVVAKEHQRKGWARKAIMEVMHRHEPLPPLKSVRSCGFIANIAPDNEASIKLFQSLGFMHIQNTYRR